MPVGCVGVVFFCVIFFTGERNKCKKTEVFATMFRLLVLERKLPSFTNLCNNIITCFFLFKCTSLAIRYQYDLSHFFRKHF